jgi:hypothetical protein
MNQYEVTLLSGFNLIVSAETEEEASAITQRVTDKRPVTVEFLNSIARDKPSSMYKLQEDQNDC